jgi:ribonucleoside-diphosphate reductase alpha chain
MIKKDKLGEGTEAIKESVPIFFSKEEVYEKSLKYFGSDKLLADIWIDKYCLKDLSGNLLELTPDDMHKRLVKEFVRIEQKYKNSLNEQEIYDLLVNFSYIIPGGSILYGAGNNYSFSSLGNCFVIGNNSDSYGGIYQTDQEQTQLMKRRSGVGHDISHLRPFLAPVTNAAGTSSGIVPFMERYSNTTREVAQDNRRGALMITLDINHPQIKDFIEAKTDLTKITGANISVKVDDNFMKAVENDEDYLLKFYKNKKQNKSNDPYSIEFSKGLEQIIYIKAKKLWDKIIHQAWKSAEPGILFWPTIQKESIPSCYGKEWEETSTNP